MTKKNYENIGTSIAKIYEIIKKYNLSLEDFYNNLITIINHFQKFDHEIYSSFFTAKIRYKEQIQEFKSRIKNHKEKKTVSSHLLRDLIKQKEVLPIPGLETKMTETIENLNSSIQDIEYKIAMLNRKIEESILDIDEESKIIENVNKLQKEKQGKIKKVSELEINLTEELEKSEYYTVKNLIEDLEKQVKEVDISLFQLSKERMSKHKEFLRLYHDIKGYEELKRKVENDFRKNVIFVERYNNIFKEANNYDKAKLFKEIYSKLYPVETPRKKKKKTKKVQMIIKKKKLLKKLKDERLKRALDKRESGERLDFYELKLIMDQKKKKKK